MVGRQDSWTKDYTEVVDFEVPLLASPPTPSPSFPSMSFAQAQGQAQAQVPQSMSQPARLSPPAAAVGGHPPPHSSQPHDQVTTHHNDDNAHHGPNPASFARPPPSHASFKNLPSSPLNPASPPHQHHQNHGMPTPSTPAGAHGPTHPPAPFGSNAPRPGSRGSQTLPSQHSAPNFSRMANEELRALNAATTAGPYPSNLTSQGLTGGSRGSMILYRRADSFVGTPVLAGEDGNGQLHFLPPPPVGGFGGGGGSNRGSMYSVSGDSIVSMATGGGPLGDSKYPPSLFSGGASTPGGALSPPTPGHRGTMYDNRGSMFTDNRTSMAFSTFGGGGGLVAYAYDPDEDDDSDDDEDDWLHDPEVAYPGSSPSKLKNKAAARKSTASSKANSDAPIAAGGVTPSASSNGGHSSTTTNSDLKAPKKAGVAVPTTGLRHPDPSKIPPNFHGMSSWSWRGIINIATLVGVITALLCLFAVYPIVRMGMDEGVASRITGNTRINATGQAVEDAFGGDDGDTTLTSTRARPTATELNPQGGSNDRRELPVARAEPLPSFPAPTWAPVGQLPILEEYELEETQGIVRMERICVPTNHGVEVEVGYTVGKEKGKAFWFNGEWRLHHQYRDDQLDRKSRPTMMLLGEKRPFTDTKEHHQDVTVSLVVGLPLEKKHTRVRYVKFHLRPLSNSRVMGGGRLKYKYGSKAKLDMCALGETKRVDLELEMGDVVARIARGEALS